MTSPSMLGTNERRNSMKSFKKKLLTLAAFSFLAFPALAGCSSIEGQENVVYAIAQVLQREDEETGDIIVTIIYTDNSVDPLTITIPAGLSGEQGVGIAEITSSVDEETGDVTLTVTYTDETVPETVFTIPAIQGLDGRGISEVTVENTDAGTTITFSFTDDSEPFSFTIPNPVGIKSVSYVTDEETGAITLTITYTDSSKVADTVITIPPGEKGDAGRGIVSIEIDEENTTHTQYALKITYTDETTETIIFDKPLATHWFYGEETNPNNNAEASEAAVGDYYLNTTTGDVYVKTSSGSWQRLFSMRSESEIVYCYITFNPQNGSFSDTLLDTYHVTGDATNPLTVTFQTGTYIDIATLDTFTPNREGYTFAGWYTDVDSETGESTVNSAHFTNITAVPNMTTLDLYATWTVASSSTTTE